MTRYQRGYVAELEAIHILKEQGYTTIRSAASKGPFDIIAFNKNHVRLISVKRVKTECNFTGEIKRINDFDNYPNSQFVQKELWILYDRIKERKKKWEFLII